MDKVSNHLRIWGIIMARPVELQFPFVQYIRPILDLLRD